MSGVINIGIRRGSSGRVRGTVTLILPMPYLVIQYKNKLCVSLPKRCFVLGSFFKVLLSGHKYFRAETGHN